MADQYEINTLAKEESWRMFRIIGELVEGFDKLSGLEPAVSIYGSARIHNTDELYLQTEEIAYRLGKAGFSIITGGGPGVMEAANKGALKAGVNSVGVNIDLPEEQAANTFTTKSLTFSHFFVRKIMLVKYAVAFVIMPGGLGTLDELTEVLTLMQTQKIRPLPIILYDEKYWHGLFHWLRQSVLTKNFISEEDFDLLRICDDPAMVIQIIQNWYQKQQVLGRQALQSELN